MTAHGPGRMFRKLTPENWQEHDDTADHIVAVKADGSTRPVTERDWATAFLSPQLGNNVPQDIRNLFEVAQAVLCYGYYFYPLYTFGSEQFYRVMDAAAHHKCKQLTSPVTEEAFSKRLCWLRDNGVLTPARFSQWDAARTLRNISSHATSQSLYDPIMAASGVSLTAELINELFEANA